MPSSREALAPTRRATPPTPRRSSDPTAIHYVKRPLRSSAVVPKIVSDRRRPGSSSSANGCSGLLVPP